MIILTHLQIYKAVSASSGLLKSVNGIVNNTSAVLSLVYYYKLEILS